MPLNLVNDLESLKVVSHTQIQSLISKIFSLRNGLPGINGEEISLVIIMFNRADLTIRLLDSLIKHIPNFKGEIIVFDNGSHNDELAKAEQYIKNCVIKIKHIKSPKNHGAPARNIAVKDSTRKWIMFLDNDIYFVSNPLESLQETILKTGAHFINLPLYDSDKKSVYCYGGTINLEQRQDELIVSSTSTYKNVFDVKEIFSSRENKHQHSAMVFFGCENLPRVVP